MKKATGIERWALRICFGLGLTMLAVGCVSARYTYVPTGLSGKATESTRKGKAFYSIPENAPTGSVRIMSGGLVKLRPAEGAAKIRAAHIRIYLSNQTSALPWTFDPKEQTASFPNQGGPSHPIQIHTGVPSSPNIAISKGELSSTDLYFALPAGEQSATEIPEFEFHWIVKTGKEVTQETTAFDRVELPEYDVAPYPYYDPYWGGGFGWGFGGWGWGGAGWRDGGFVEGAGEMPVKPVVVHR